MFRFTIRDVLWLIVVVGMGCAVLVNIRERHEIASKLNELERKAKRQSRDRARTEQAMLDELKRIGGRRVRGWGYVIDSSEPTGYKYHFDYADEDLTKSAPCPPMP